MKKATKWIGIAVLTPFLLFFILTALLYLPPVQNWAVQKATAIASEKTGMEISIDHVSLEFPLDLGINGFRVIKQNDSLPQIKDTIADVKKLVADVRLLPLFGQRVIIDELSLTQARLNTNGFISDLRIKGDFNELWLTSKGIDLDEETVEVNGARLADARLDIALSDTAATDTTTSQVRWRINADSLNIIRTDVTLHLPGDTLNVGAYMARAVARKADVNLSTNTYKVESLDWYDGRLAYDNVKAPHLEGLDYNHIALSGFRLGIDSISYAPSGTSLFLRQAAMKDKSGLEITDFSTGVRLDSIFNNVQLTNLRLQTTDSNILGEANVDFNIADSLKPGMMMVRLNAQLGKQDLIRFTGNLPQAFIERYPSHPLAIKGSVNGNMRKMAFTGLDISLPTALHLAADGTAENVTDMRYLKADVKLNGQAQDLNFITALFDPKMTGKYRIPNGMALDGMLKADGPHYATQMTLREDKGNIKMDLSATVPLDAKGEPVISHTSYDATVKVNQLNLHHFMPKDSIYTVSADIRAKGYGTDILSNRSYLMEGHPVAVWTLESERRYGTGHTERRSGDSDRQRCQ